MRLTIICLAIPVALAACGNPAEEADEPMVAETTAAADSALPPAEDLETTMPRAMQGTWRESVGARVTAPECDVTDQANRGKVMTVSDEGFAYFDTGGRIATVAEREENRIRATFANASPDTPGETTLVFEAQDGGETLIMTRVGEDAAAEPVRYLRCPEE